MKFSLVLPTLLWVCWSQTIQAAVIAIDFGAEWAKVALVRHGRPMDLVLNTESKRKTATVMTMRDGERLFGSEAVNLATRFPQNSYPNLKALLGRFYNDSMVASYREIYDNGMVEDSVRGTVAFEQKLVSGQKVILSVEEIVAMQLRYFKQLADTEVGASVTGCVITVPPFYNHYERQALKDAAHLAGLQVLELMNDETAVALHYGLSREFDSKPQHHIFYDMGSGSTAATLVSFHTVSTPVAGSKKNQTVPHIDVLAVGYDRLLGGHTIDVRLQQYLADRFIEVYHDQAVKRKLDLTKLRQDSRAMSKLLREATRVKLILSANQDTTAAVESLFGDLNLRIKVTRQELESLCVNLHERILAPIRSVLSSSQLTVDDVQSFVLVGGGTRVPLVQEVLRNFAGDKLSKNVNADEAAVMGAAFRAAGLSRQFVVKNIVVNELNLFPIELHYSSNSDAQQLLSTVVYQNTTGAKMTAFKKAEDFSVLVQYAETEGTKDPLFGPRPLFQVQVQGVKDVLQRYAENLTDPTQTPKVRLLTELDSSGILRVVQASTQLNLTQTVAVQKKKETLLGNIAKMFGGGSGDNETEGDAANAANNETVYETVYEKKQYKEKVNLPLTVTPLGLVPLSEVEKSQITQRIKLLEEEDAQRRLKAESRNAVESFIYAHMEHLEREKFIEASTEKERDALSKALSSASEWLYEVDDAEQSTASYREKLASLEKLTSPITRRLDEHADRDNQITSLEQTFSSVRLYATKTKVVAADDRGQTDSELDQLLSKVETAENWLKEKVAAQSALALNQDVVLTVAEIKAQSDSLKVAMQLLMAKPKPKKTTSTSTTPSSSTTSTASSTEETSSTEPEDEQEQESHEEL